MALLPKRPFINIERACKELNCDLDEITDCWLSNEINFYYMLQGEKIILTKSNSLFNDNVSAGDGLNLLIESSRIYKNEHIVNTDINVNIKDGKLVISFKAYGPLLISPIRATQFIENNVINIISPERALERTRSNLLNGGFCFILYPNTKEPVTFEDIDHIEGLSFPINKLFVKREDIAKFIDPSECHQVKNQKYWVNVAVYTQNYYLQKNIFIPKSKLAAKVASAADVAQSTVMKDWFKDTDIKTAEDLKGTNKHGNKPTGDFDLFNPETCTKLNF